MFAPLTKTREATDTRLAEVPRRQVTEILKERLADAIALQAHCREAHWYATGPDVASLHKLYIDVYWSVESYVSLLTKRVVELGGARSGALRMAPARSELDESVGAAIVEDDHVQRMCLALAAFGAAIRTGVRKAEALEDPVSAELCRSISQGADQCLDAVESRRRPLTATRCTPSPREALRPDRVPGRRP
jgi:DNA-binding ferritin-like protein